MPPSARVPSAARAPAFSYLSDDLVLTCLASLPVRDLLRTARVCKQWHAAVGAMARMRHAHMTRQHWAAATMTWAAAEVIASERGKIDGGQQNSDAKLWSRKSSSEKARDRAIIDTMLETAMARASRRMHHLPDLALVYVSRSVHPRPRRPEQEQFTVDLADHAARLLPPSTTVIVASTDGVIGPAVEEEASEPSTPVAMHEFEADEPNGSGQALVVVLGVLPHIALSWVGLGMKAAPRFVMNGWQGHRYLGAWWQSGSTQAGLKACICKRGQDPVWEGYHPEPPGDWMGVMDDDPPVRLLIFSSAAGVSERAWSGTVLQRDFLEYHGAVGSRAIIAGGVAQTVAIKVPALPPREGHTRPQGESWWLSDDNDHHATAVEHLILRLQSSSSQMSSVSIGGLVRGSSAVEQTLRKCLEHRNGLCAIGELGPALPDPVPYGPGRALHSVALTEEPLLPHPRAALLFVCNHRGIIHHGEPHAEAGAIARVLAARGSGQEVAVAGFFSAGEFGPAAELFEGQELDNPVSDFLTYHCVAAILADQ